jgi:hypothetical protein
MRHQAPAIFLWHRLARPHHVGLHPQPGRRDQAAAAQAHQPGDASQEHGPRAGRHGRRGRLPVHLGPGSPTAALQKGCPVVWGRPSPCRPALGAQPHTTRARPTRARSCSVAVCSRRPTSIPPPGGRPGSGSDAVGLSCVSARRGSRTSNLPLGQITSRRWASRSPTKRIGPGWRHAAPLPRGTSASRWTGRGWAMTTLGSVTWSALS